MPQYIVTLSDEEIQGLSGLNRKGYRIKHAQILLKLDRKPENKDWTYDRIKDAFGVSNGTITGMAKRFVMEGMESALGRKQQQNRHHKVTGDVEAQICAIACSDASYVLELRKQSAVNFNDVICLSVSASRYKTFLVLLQITNEYLVNC